MKKNETTLYFYKRYLSGIVPLPKTSWMCVCICICMVTEMVTRAVTASVIGMVTGSVTESVK